MLLDLQSINEQYNMDVRGVIHIGAHWGQEVESYKSYGWDNILLFEPQPSCYSILEGKFGDDDNVVLVNKALGPKPCNMKMYVERANSGMSSSLLKPCMHLDQYPGILFNEEIEVGVVTLDGYLEESGLDQSNYNMINIDVQGFELEVFKGAESTLKNVDYIITEINRAEVYEGCAKHDELDKHLGSYGFKRVETNWAGWTWGDAFYIKDV